MKKTNTISRFLIAVSLFVLQTVVLWAQSFSVSEIDVSNFPQISSYFVTLDANGESVESLSPNDFIITENNKNLSPTVSIECDDILTDPPLNICLVIDQSNSMNALSDPSNPSSEKYLQWVKEGASSFINALNFSNGTQVEIIGFALGMKILRTFTSDRNALLSTINGMVFDSGTNYNSPLLDTPNGAIAQLRYNTPPDVRRVIVFLTDGDPDELFETKVLEIIDGANAANIQIYAITMNIDVKYDLQTIASNTGGKAFPVKTKAELNSVYAQIASDIKSKKICKLNWTANYGCGVDDYNRQVAITYKGFESPRVVNTQYTAPSGSIASTTISPSIQFFDDPEVGVNVDKLITISPQNSDITIQSSQITPSKYFSVVDWDANSDATVNFPITIKKGNSQTIKVRFTQQDAKSYRKADLVLHSEPCDLYIDLVGGLSQVNIVSPNGGEFFSTCDTVEIKWGGVDAYTPVNLYYHTANLGWNLIAKDVSGLSYRWKPPYPSNSYMIKATVYSAAETVWLKSFGSTANEELKGLILHPSGNYLYVCGQYSGEMQIEDQNISAGKNKDVFVAQFTSDGQLVWIKTITGKYDETVNSMCMDSEGNVFITGKAYQSSSFENYSPQTASSSLPYMYVAKYNPDGVRVGLFTLAATNAYTSFEAEGLYVQNLESTRQIRVQGNYRNELKANSINLSKTGTRFSVTLSAEELILNSSTNSWLTGNVPTPLTAYDSDGNQFIGTNFTNSITKGHLSRKSNGGEDIAIYKVGTAKSTEDECDATFAVANIELQFTQTEVNMGDCLIGDVVNQTVSGLITNVGEIPAYITRQTLENNDEFQIVTDLTQGGILPGESQIVAFRFMPKQKGTVSTTMSIDIECGNTISLTLLGNGVCTFSALDTLNFTNTAINKTSDQTFSAVFHNPNPVDIQISPEIIGADAQYFHLLEPTGSYLAPANSDIDFKIQFAPTEERTYTAQMIYNAPSECSSTDTTQLVADGVNGDLILTGCNFGAYRLLTENTLDNSGTDANITIHNSSDYPAVITTIAFANPTEAQNARFEFVQLPDLPYTIAGNSDLSIPVLFSPQREDKTTTLVNVRIEGKDKDFTAEISGEGWLPKYTFDWECPPAVKVGETSTGTLTLTSTDTKVGLKVHNIRFNSDISDYSFVGNVQNIDIAIGETRKFDVLFTPTKAGMSDDEFVITTDAAPGPDNNPTENTAYSVSCEVLGVEVGDGLQFGNLMQCDNSTKSVEIKNLSSATDLMITGYRIDNNSDNAFSVNLANNVNVAPGGTLDVEVTFAPRSVKTYSAVLVLLTADGDELNFPLSGTAADYAIYSPIDEYSDKPGSTIEIPVYAEIPSFANSQIENLKFRFMCNPKVVLPIETSDNAWTLSKLDTNEFEIAHTGLTNTPFNGELVKVKAKVYLADSTNTSISLRPYFNECEGQDTLISVFTVTGVCNLNYTKLQFSGSHTNIQNIAPNPAYNVVKINYSIALNAPVKIELFNMMGELVDMPINQTMDAGNYELNYDLSNFGNGQYYLRLTQSSSVIVKSLIIAK